MIVNELENDSDGEISSENEQPKSVEGDEENVIYIFL